MICGADRVRCIVYVIGIKKIFSKKHKISVCGGINMQKVGYVNIRGNEGVLQKKFNKTDEV